MWESNLADLIPREREARELKLAVMTGPDSLKLGKLELAKEDLLISQHLTDRVCVQAFLNAPPNGGPCTDKSKYWEKLKAGDTVLVYQISDSKFVIIDRVVSL